MLTVAAPGRRLLMAILATALLGGCTAPAKKISSQQIPGETQVTSQSRSSVAVAGEDSSWLEVQVEPGDFSDDGTIRSTSSDEPPPEGFGFTPAGDVRQVTVSGPLAEPLSITFDAGQDHPEDVPVVWRQDAAEGWYPIAVGDAGGSASAERTEFSPHLPGWANPATWLQKSGTWVRGRTSPPSCGSAPDWATLTKPELDILLACLDTNQNRAELRIINNRSIVQQVAIPDGVAYADVEGQPETMRKLVRSVAGGQDVVLLPAGTELRIGFAQSQQSRQVTVTPTMTPLALASELLVQLADLADAQGSMAVLPALLNVAGCAGLKAELLSGVVPDSVDAVKNLGTGLLKCAAALADPAQALSVAQQVVAAQAGLDPAIVGGDASFRGRVQTLEGRLNLLGKLARAFKVADLVRAAYSIWEAVGEELGRAVSNLDPAVVSVDLAAPASPRPSTPNDEEWWRNQQVPTGWETGETVTFRDGEATVCSEQNCGYSMGALSVQQATGTQRPTATMVLVRHDGDGFPLAQTVMVMTAEPDGLILQRASDTARSIPENRALCDMTAVSLPSGDVEQTFSNCFDASGTGSQVWHLSGTLLALD